MSCVSSTYRAELVERLTKKKAQLESVQDAIDDLIGENVEEYQLNTGDMMQRARRRKLKDLQEFQSTLEAEIDSLTRRLASCGVVNINLRRKRGSYV